MKALLIFVFFILPNMGHSQDCALPYQEHQLSLVKETCEFPEGNKTHCAHVQADTKGKGPRKGPVIFRKGSSFNSFCVSATIKEPKTKRLARIISSSRSDDLRAYLLCPAKTNEATIILASPEKRVRCSLRF